MRLHILGSGSESNLSKGSQSFVIWKKDGKGLLINCGPTTLNTLKKSRYLKNIDSLYLSSTDRSVSENLGELLIHFKNDLSKKIKFYGLSDNLDFLKSINPDFVDNAESYFIINELDSLQTIPVKFKEGVSSSAFYNYGLLYSGLTSENLLDTVEAFNSKVILHDVSFGDLNFHVDFSELCRAAEFIKRKTWLIGYPEDDSFQSLLKKTLINGFAGLVEPNQLITLKK
jgi:hypothetical protein